jgi:hypothetical protein
MRRALEITKLDNAIMAFLFHPPSRELLDRCAPDSGEQAALAAEIRGLLPKEPEPGNRRRSSPRWADSPRLVDPLSQGELRVLRYLLAPSPGQRG